MTPNTTSARRAVLLVGTIVYLLLADHICAVALENRTASETITVTSSPSEEPTSTMSGSVTVQTISGSPTGDHTQTFSRTVSEFTGSMSFSDEKSMTFSTSLTLIESDTETISPTHVLTRSPTGTFSSSLSDEPTSTVSSTLIATMSASPSDEATQSWTVTPPPTPSGSTSMPVTITVSVSPSQSRTPAETRTATFSRTRSPPPTPTRSLSQSEGTDSLTLVDTETPTTTFSNSQTFTLTESESETLSEGTGSLSGETKSTTIQATETATSTFSRTDTVSGSLTFTLSESVPITATAPPTFTMEHTPSPTGTFSLTATGPTLTLLDSASATATFSESVSRSEIPMSFSSEATTTASLNPTSTVTESASTTVTSTLTSSASETTTQSVSETATEGTWSVSSTLRSTDTETISSTETETDSASSTITDSLSSSTSATLSESETVSFTDTMQPTFTTTQELTATAGPSVTQDLSATLSGSATQTHIMTPTFTFSSSHVASETRTLSETPTVTMSTSLMPSATLTLVQTDSFTASRTPKASESVTLSVTTTMTASTSNSKTDSPSTSETDTLVLTESHTSSASVSASVTQSLSASESTSTSDSMSTTPSKSKVPTPSPTLTVSPSLSQSSSVSQSFSGSISSSVTPPPTPTPSSSESFSTSVTMSTSWTPSSSESRSQSVSFSASLSVSITLTSITAELPITVTPTIDPTPSYTISPTGTETPSWSIAPSLTRPPSVTTTFVLTQSVSGSLSKSRTDGTTTHSLPPTTSKTLSASPSISGSRSQSISNSRSGGTFTPSFPATRSNTFSPTIQPPRTPTLSLSKSLSMSASGSLTITASGSQSYSVTQSVSKSTSVSTSASPTQSISTSGTASSSVTGSMSETMTRTPSSSATVTSILSESATLVASATDSVSKTITPPPTPTRSVSPETRELSTSGSMTLEVTGSLTITPPSSASRSKSTTGSRTTTFTGLTLTENATESVGSVTTTMSRTLTSSLEVSASMSRPTMRIEFPIAPRRLLVDNPFEPGAKARQEQAAADDPYYFMPKIFASSINAGGNVLYRSITIRAEGDLFDVAADRNDHTGTYFYNHIHVDIGRAQTFAIRLFKLFTPATIQVNASTLTITFAADSDFKPTKTELVRIRFDRHVLAQKMFPVEDTFEFAVHPVDVSPESVVTETPVPGALEKPEVPDGGVSPATEDGTAATAGLATASSSTIAGLAAAQSLSRMSSQISVARCAGVFTELSILEHPTQLSIKVGDEPNADQVAHFLGALIMNLVVALLIQLLHFVVSLGYQQYSARKKNYYDASEHMTYASSLVSAMKAMQFPSKTIFIFILYPACVKSAVALFFFSSSGGVLLLALLFILPWVGLVVGAAYLLMSPSFSSRFVKRGTDHLAPTSWSPSAAGSPPQTKVLNVPPTPAHPQGDFSEFSGEGIRIDDPNFNDTYFEGDNQDYESTLDGGRGGGRGGYTSSAASSVGSGATSSYGESKKDRIIRLLKRYLLPRGEWVDVNAPQIVGFSDRFGSYFGDYRAPFKYFLLVELFVSTILGGADGYAVATRHCTSTAVILLIVLLAFLALLIWKRPYNIRANNPFFIFLIAVQVIIAILTVKVAASNDDHAFKGLQACSLWLQYMLLIRSLSDIGIWVYETCWERPQRQKEKERRKYGSEDGEEEHHNTNRIAVVDGDENDVERFGFGKEPVAEAGGKDDPPPVRSQHSLRQPDFSDATPPANNRTHDIPAFPLPEQGLDRTFANSYWQRPSSPSLSPSSDGAGVSLAHVVADIPHDLHHQPDQHSFGGDPLADLGNAHDGQGLSLPNTNVGGSPPTHEQRLLNVGGGGIPSTQPNSSNLASEHFTLGFTREHQPTQPTSQFNRTPTPPQRVRTMAALADLQPLQYGGALNAAVAQHEVGVAVRSEEVPDASVFLHPSAAEDQQANGAAPSPHHPPPLPLAATDDILWEDTHGNDDHYDDFPLDGDDDPFATVTSGDLQQLPHTTNPVDAFSPPIRHHHQDDGVHSKTMTTEMDLEDLL